MGADDDLGLAEIAFQLLAKIPPPSFVEVFDHHLDDDDVVGARGATVGRPAALRRRAGEGGDAAEMV